MWQKVGIERSYSELTNLIDQLASNFIVRENVAKANIKLFSSSSLMKTYALEDDEEERYTLITPSLLKLFKSYIRAYPEYDEIKYLLPDGYEDARATNNLITNAYEEELTTPFFQFIKNTDADIVSRVLTNPDNGKLSLQVARPLRLINPATEDPINAQPSLRGFMVVTMSLDFIEKQVTDTHIGKTGYVFVIDNKGKILFHKNPLSIGKYLSGDTLSKITEMDHVTPLSAGYEESEAYFSVRRLHSDILLVGFLPVTELHADTQKLAEAVTWIIVVTIIITVFALLVSVNSVITLPLKLIIDGIKDIGKGNLTPSINLSRQDEFGQLAKSFQKMAESLNNSRQKIEHLAYHDSLTGLPNRLLFTEYLEHMIALAHRENNKMALLFLDLDNFKRVNDTLGHNTGDKLLKSTAERLQSILRKEDFLYKQSSAQSTEVLARLGGDEFIILLPKITGSSDAVKVATRILNTMKESFDIEDKQIFTGTSIGITLFPADGNTVDDLVKRADSAMYHAKKLGRNNFQFYSSAFNLETFELLSIENRLRQALENDGLELHYQPLVDAKSGIIKGHEALLRWRDSDHGLIAPSQFIPVAEDSGLILPIGEWVLNEACKQNQAWQKYTETPLFIAVNVSAYQLQRQNFSDVVNLALTKSGMNPVLLELEVTESVLMDTNELVIGYLETLRSLGVSISLDDFGTGYSSLNRLKKLPIDKLKIDQSFVNDMIDNPDNSAIVAAILSLANILSLQTTAEGVEDIEQAKALMSHGCDFLQGFLFSKPQPPAEAKEIISHRFASHLSTAESLFV